MTHQVFPLEPSTFQRHQIHSQERQWAETNCYVDVLIELLNSWGYEPIAALPFTLGIDFEGDQWTFFKFPHADLDSLFGLDIQELQMWKPLVRHLEEQVSLGRPVLVEMDSFYLPDTAGSAYQLAHVKSTIAVIEIDTEQRRLGYFHGQGYYQLNGDDFTNVLHLNGLPHPSVLPPYVEIVKKRNRTAARQDSLVKLSLQRMQSVLRQLPDRNPFDLFRSRFARDLQWLSNEPLETFHQYSFATLRQFGACYELAATYLRWLQDQQIAGLDRAIAGLEELSTSAKTLQFQLARAMARKRTLDISSIDQMAATWRSLTEDLKQRFLIAD